MSFDMGMYSFLNNTSETRSKLGAFLFEIRSAMTAISDLNKGSSEGNLSVELSGGGLDLVVFS